MAQVIPVVDEDWRKLQNSFQTARNPRKWKYQMVMGSGAYTKVWFDGQFRTKSCGEICTLVPLSKLVAMDRTGTLLKPHGGEPGALPNSHGGFWERVDGNYTGNHRSRPCHVKVPTAPGQPVRG